MMNDRFKFRVWDKKNNLYFGCDYPPRWYNVDELYGDVDEIFIEGMYKIANDDDYVLEQCTGLKDKNGKLIYEGDILKTLDGSICFVVWIGISFWVESPGSEAKDLEHDSFYEHCEVIGNIHENPELLKESK
jgi:uncharacterized phage protein (TIGR01671 family)